jgi:pyruvate dehydrogenase E2 component (dihydrolipoamide acetyltransferase)
MKRIQTVAMPDIGEGVVEGEVMEWLKHENDMLKQDEPVVVVMTDKATVELPAPHPGKLVKQYYQKGEIAIKDKPLYDIELEQQGVAEAIKSEEIQKSPPSTLPRENLSASSEEADQDIQKKGLKREKALATPPVRHLAKEMGIDINAISPTGKEGRVTLEDLKSHYEQGKSGQNIIMPVPIPHLPADEEVTLSGIRNLMAKKMSLSKKHIPHFSYFEKTDVTHLIALRQKIKQEAEKEGIKITYMPFFIRALSLCIKKHPEINGSFDEMNNTFIIHACQNVGIAVATPLGLIVAVLKNVQNMSLEQLIRSYETLKIKALEGKLAPSDMKDSTITVSNFGVLGGTGQWATPIINYPEVAIVAFAKIHKQPVIKHDTIVVKDMLNISWSFDHRIIDGEKASAVAHDFSLLIHNPAPLL